MADRYEDTTEPHRAGVKSHRPGALPYRLSEDPKGFGAGDYNLYRYCENDPLNMTDPTGLMPDAEIMNPQAWENDPTICHPSQTTSHFTRRDSLTRLPMQLLALFCVLFLLGPIQLPDLQNRKGFVLQKTIEILMLVKLFDMKYGKLN